MKICVSCNNIEGHLVLACGGVMEPVHKTHSILIENQKTGRPACTACDGELGVELRQPCPMAVHSTHDLESIRLKDECSKCGVTYRGMLIEPCRSKARRFVLNNMVSTDPENFARIKVDITGLPEVQSMVDNAVKVSFLAGFEMANELWKLSDGGDGISDEEMNARFEDWIKNVNKFRDSEEALAKLREKLNGSRGL